jgi:hypothetical protein
MTARERDLVNHAIDVLINAEPGVGPDGMTMAEMEAEWEQGKTACDSALYDACQHVYRLLENAMGKTK